MSGWRYDRSLRSTARTLIDFSVIILAYLCAYALRFDFKLPDMFKVTIWRTLLLVSGVELLALRIYGCHRLLWRFVSLNDVLRLLWAALFSGYVLICVRVLLPFLPWIAQSGLSVHVPITVVLLNSALFFMGAVGVRLMYRASIESGRAKPSAVRTSGLKGDAAPRRCLLVGAGNAGNTVVRDLKLHGGVGMQIVGFLDDDPAKRDVDIQGVPVVGTISDLPARVRELDVTEVVVTMANVPREVIRRVTQLCESVPIPARIIPGYFEIIGGSVSISRIRDVAIEDLLGRDIITLDEVELARFVNGKRVLVTGAGGSIGSELARQVARIGPSGLLLLERSENALYEIHRELQRCEGLQELVPLIADIADERRMTEIIARWKPQILLHAAAHKHVPMMEWNPCEALKNNTLATARLGELARAGGVDTFVLISTDKAVNPSSVMGATKRMAELALQELNRRGGTRFVAVRFGNVLGSAGSVVPLFREQIRKGGPVTVTHPDMVRYFMTIPEASSLVLQAAAMAHGGEIFVLDMGTPVRIRDLAEEMIRLSGFKANEDIAIVYSGMRPGEKLFEELSTSEEGATKTRHPRIFVGRIQERPAAEIARMLERLGTLAEKESDTAAVRAAIAEFVPEAFGGKG